MCHCRKKNMDAWNSLKTNFYLIGSTDDIRLKRCKYLPCIINSSRILFVYIVYMTSRILSRFWLIVIADYLTIQVNIRILNNIIVPWFAVFGK